MHPRLGSYLSRADHGLEELTCCCEAHLGCDGYTLSHNCLLSMLASAQSLTYSCPDRLKAASYSFDGSSCDNYKVL